MVITIMIQHKIATELHVEKKDLNVKGLAKIIAFPVIR